MKTIAIYCGSKMPENKIYIDETIKLIKYLVKNNYKIVYGGANVGLMGIVADEALSLGGHVIGVMPNNLIKNEIAHRNLSELHLVNTMHERKAMMANLADVFIALPGGYGTLDEIFEVVTWNQIGIHNKPCIIYNIDSYYDNLKAFIQQASDDMFLNPNLLHFISDIEALKNLSI